MRLSIEKNLILKYFVAIKSPKLAMETMNILILSHILSFERYN